MPTKLLSAHKQKLSEQVTDKRKVKYMYWVSDNKGWGYYKIVSSIQEIPKGKPFQECICIG